MIRTKGEAGTGNVVSAVKHARLLNTEIETAIRAKPEGRDKMVESIMDGYSKLEDYSDIGARVTSTPFGDLEDLRNEVSSVLKEVTEIERLPVVTFSAGGIATPSDAALMMSH